MMKAIVQIGYGSPEFLKLKEVDKPVIEENEVLVKVYAAALNAGDLFSLKGSPWLVRFTVGFPRPKDYILGWDMAGRVEAIGDRVTQFKIGDEVFAACSHTFAEYVRAPESVLALKPTKLSFEQAAAVPTAGLTALQGLRNMGNLQPDQKVLVNGASGGVGTFAVQIAKALGAEVTGVCSTRNAEMVRTIGADHIIDYTKADFTKNGHGYDLILDNVANHSFADLRQALTSQGVIIPNSGHGGMGYVIKAFALSPFVDQVGSMYMAKPNSEDMVFLKDLIDAGQITPVIDKTYPLCDAPEAFRYLEEEHPRGKVVLAAV